MRLVPLMLSFAACSQSVSPQTPSMNVTPTDGTSVGDDDDSSPPANEAPIADAGEDFSAYVADQVQLDGSASYDPDGDPLTFEWTLTTRPASSSATLINASRPNPSFFADRPGTYQVTLAVNDALSVSTDEVEITVAPANDGPVANAGPDQSVGVGQRVVLDGSNSYDPDDDPLTFTWTFASIPAGSAATLDAPATALPQFTADRGGVYVVDLVVSDGHTDSLVDSVSVTASDSTGTTGCGCGAADREIRQRLPFASMASGGLLGLLLAIRRRRTA